MLQVHSVKSRFWIIVLVVWMVAISASAVTVWLSARPHLTHNQTRTLNSLAETTVLRLRDGLLQETMVLEFMARQPALVSAAMGLEDDSFLLSDYLESFVPSDSVDRIQLLDFEGVEIAEYIYREGVVYAFPEEIRAAFLRQVIDTAEAYGTEGFTIPLLHHHDGDVAHVFVATPIMFAGSLQGVIAAQLEIELFDKIPKAELVSSMQLEHLFRTPGAEVEGHAAHPEGAVHIDVPGFGMSLVIEPNWSVLQQAGANLVRDTVLALSLALGAPFILLAVLGHRAIVQPHQDLQKQKKALAELAAIAEKANDAIMVTDLAGRIEWVNNAFERLSGYRAQDVRGKSPGAFLQGPDSDPGARALIRRHLAELRPVQTEIQNYTAGGKPYWISLSISPLIDERDRPYGFVAISNDITHRRMRESQLREAKARIEHQANHDALTGLPNRRAFDQVLKTRAADPENYEIVVVRIDLDHFKYVNDTHGHAAGDAVLVNVAQILREETKATEIAARVGGDEFVVLMGKGYGMDAARQMAERILHRIADPMPFGSCTLSVGASFGIAGTVEGMLLLEDVIAGADVALYEAKEAGRGSVHLYTPSLHARATEHRDTAAKLRGAIKGDQFVPFYQPQIDVRDGSILGLEVLSRWQHPDGRLLSPDRYLPVAEKIGILTEVDAALFRRTALEIGAINGTSRLVPKVSFNVAAQRLADPGVLDAAVALSREANFGVAFEILESVLMDNQDTAMRYNLDKLRDAGVGLQIDDFGTGHASIVGLMQARPDCLKIDQQLIRPLTGLDGARQMVSAIVDIARALGIDVIAEGVESASPRGNPAEPRHPCPAGVFPCHADERCGPPQVSRVPGGCYPGVPGGRRVRSCRPPIRSGTLSSLSNGSPSAGIEIPGSMTSCLSGAAAEPGQHPAIDSEGLARDEVHPLRRARDRR
jgi:diguanylate cyclase (GGDEF)-like protein/PAS domain S-box-containing protein